MRVHWSRVLINWLVTSIAVAAAVIVLHAIDPSWVTLEGDSAWLAVVLTAAVLGLLDAFVRPVLQFLSCGCIVATLGLFLIAINMFVLWLASEIAQFLHSGFSFNGFWPTLLGAIIISAVSFLLTTFLPYPEEDPKGWG